MRVFVGLTVLLMSAVLLGGCASDAQGDTAKANASEEKCVRETKRVYQPYGGGGGGSFVEVPVRKCDKTKRDRNNSGEEADLAPASLPRSIQKSYLFPDLGEAEISNRYKGCVVEPDENQVSDYVASIKRQSRGIINLLPQSPPPPFSVGRLCVDQSRLDEGWFHWNQAFVSWGVDERLSYRIAVPLAAIDMPEGPFSKHAEGAFFQKWLTVSMGESRGYDPRYKYNILGPRHELLREYFEEGKLFKTENIFEYGDIKLQHYEYSYSSNKYYDPSEDYLLSEDLFVVCRVSGFFDSEEAYLTNQKMNVVTCRIFDEEVGVVMVLEFPMKNARRSAEFVSIALDQVRKTVVLKGSE
jgi:hypothetical protein